ncbi:MAG TPA: hypothetical protein VGJ39_11515 [Vicinamibacterales bacterium]
MICPLCGTRRARRGCPALGQQICAVCCGTKRLVQIPCPSDCVYLATAREHPPAVVVRRQQRDVESLVQSMRDLSERQSQLFFLITSFLQRYEPPELQPLVDIDVVEAVAALAGTFETAARGVIYDHRPASMPADRLATALKPVIAEAGQHGGSAFERDAAVVLRRLEEAAREITAADPSNRRAYLDLLGRVLREDKNPEGTDGDAPRLIVP